MTIKLGDLAKDKITGFKGIVISRTDWLNGCVRFMLQSQKLQKEGMPQPAETFDEQQLVLLKSNQYGFDQQPVGGPKPSPKLPKTPSRR